MISAINFSNSKLIEECIKIAKKEYLDNIVLLGDLYPPCNKESQVFGLLNSEKKLITFFVIFYGFKAPSIVLPTQLTETQLDEIIDYIAKNIKGIVGFVVLDKYLEKLKQKFNIIEISSEYCMYIDNGKHLPDLDISEVKHAKENEYQRIDRFYQSIGAYPYCSLQLESGLYHYIEKNNQIIACGGTHFETDQLAHLGNIYTIPEFRRKGYGKKLVTKLIRTIFNYKNIISLYVVKENIIALNLYLQLGFKIHQSVNIITVSN